jgi:hypothetical protein
VAEYITRFVGTVRIALLPAVVPTGVREDHRVERRLFLSFAIAPVFGHLVFSVGGIAIGARPTEESCELFSHLLVIGERRINHVKVVVIEVTIFLLGIVTLPLLIRA